MIDDTAEEIREMQTSSSSVVAVKAAQALEAVLDREFETVEEFLRAFERNSDALRRANPSHASLQTTQRQLVTVLSDGTFDDVAAAKQAAQDAIDEVVEDVETAKHRAATAAADQLKDGMTVMTHDYSTTVLEAVELAAEDGAYLDVYVKESRPRFLGRRTARVLAEIDRVDPHLIVDSACGHYLPECDHVLIGMDCIVEDTLYNRVGTYPLAATADDVGVPVTVIGSSAKLVHTGFRFENDYRTSSEVMREPPEGFSVENPAYDATPVRLLDSVVTDDGVKEF